MRRRTWLLGTAAATGALIVGWGVLPQRSRVGAPSLFPPRGGDVALNGWIKITPDGGVVLAMPRSEMGQGVHTALPMLAAEELEVPLASVRIEQAGTDAIYGNVAVLYGLLPFRREESGAEGGNSGAKVDRWLVGKVGRELGIDATAGSSSVVDAWEVVRLAAATARASLLGAASLQWRLPVEELAVREGVVSHPSGRSAGYGELAKFGAATPPGVVQLKPAKAWTLIGRPAPRLDVPAKVDGTARFGLDVRLPGMKFAAVRLCPVLGGAPGRVDPRPALVVPGVERVVLLPAYAGSAAGFAVVANGTWQAQQGAHAVQAEWRPRPGRALDSRQAEAELEAAVLSDAGRTFHERGDAAPAEREAARVLEAWYRAPYLAHAAMEPMNCTARVAGGRVELWVPTQAPRLCAEAAARVAGVPVDRVAVHVTLLGGAFGRRLEVDYAAIATRVAMDCGGAPVQLVWSREEDTTHDFYRPMQVARLRAGLDARGGVASLRIESAGDAVAPRYLARTVPALAAAPDLPGRTVAEGHFALPYGFAHQHMSHAATRVGIPVGFWRSGGHSHNAFASECFMDELAAAGEQDPVAFRRQWLERAPRHRAVLELAARKAGWGHPLPRGRARGVALHESFGTIVAQVAEVSLDGVLPRVHRVVCAVDCGVAVNPAVVAQQMEGAVVFALSAALFGRIDVEAGVVQQGNFHNYPSLRMEAAPQVETWLVESQREPGGVGEAGVPPLAPAVANALFALTGERRRSLPFTA